MPTPEEIHRQNLERDRLLDMNRVRRFAPLAPPAPVIPGKPGYLELLAQVLALFGVRSTEYGPEWYSLSGLIEEVLEASLPERQTRRRT